MPNGTEIVMTAAEAKEALLLHAFSHPDSATDPRAEAGFLGSLRPFRGLNERNFVDVMAALRIVAPQLAGPGPLDRELVSALWGICHYALAWGVHPDGMLQRNKLITAADTDQLAGWVQEISYAVSMLLDGDDGAFQPLVR
jgi:hypothetical protein